MPGTSAEPPEPPDSLPIETQAAVVAAQASSVDRRAGITVVVLTVFALAGLALTRERWASGALPAIFARATLSAEAALRVAQTEEAEARAEAVAGLSPADTTPGGGSDGSADGGANEGGGGGLDAGSLDATADAARPPGSAALVPNDAAIPPAPTQDAMARLVQTEPPLRDLVDLAWRMGRTAELAQRTRAEAPPVRSEGDHETFWVHDIVAERYFEVDAVLEVITDAAYFWVQEGRGFDPVRLQTGAAEFSDVVVPDVRRLFGDEWIPGVDLDPRMHVLHHQPIRGVAGYYSSTDEFTREVEPYSNEREMFYINMDIYEPGSYDWVALLSHEFQHMIHWHADPNESVWSNEGLSELASTLAGYPSSSASLFFREPGTPLLEWNENPNGNGADYAASLAFFTYVLARFGEESIRSIVAAAPNGAAGVEAGLSAVGHAVSFDDVFLDWAVTNAVDDPTFVDGRFSYRDRPLESVQAVDAGMAEANASVAPYGTDYYDVTRLVAASDDTSAELQLDLHFEGDDSVGLLQAAPDSSGAVWWSGRGDSADSRLTGRFDLTGVTTATLAFRMWHALEPSWDYAYFLVSTDGGATWETLGTLRTTDTDPNGNNYGNGLTGLSGGWVDEELDLGPYVGNSVLVRFEVVTDDAVSLSGLALDDFRLDAVGFADNADEANPLWLAEGFLRLVPIMPQRWAVQVIVHESGRILAVERPLIAPDGTGAVRVDRIPPTAQITVAVSSLTPGTRQPSAYRLTSQRPEEALARAATPWVLAP